MKIAMILEKWGYLGGMEQLNISMLKAFVENGYECALAYGRETIMPVKNERSFAVIKHENPALSESSPAERNKNQLNDMLNFLEDFSPDIIYLGHIRNIAIVKEIITRWPTIAMVQSLWLTCMRECKVFYFSRKPCPYKHGLNCFLRGCFIGKPRQSFGLFRYNSLSDLSDIQSVYKQADAIVVTSRFVSSSLSENGFDPLKIHNFGNFNEYVPENISPLPENGDLLFVGRVDRYKGLDVLLKILVKCKTKPHLTVIGEGPFMPIIKKLVSKLRLHNQVELLGWVPQDKLTNYYQRATAIAVSSLCPETFCKVGIEALSHGRPVVAFDVGGVGEWLINGETGYLIKWKDMHSFAASIDNIFSNIQSAKDLGIRGRKLVLKKFTKDVYIEQWQALLHNIIMGSSDNKKNSRTAFLIN